MVSLNPTTRHEALGVFKLGVEIGDLLGAETLQLATYAPPVRYLHAKTRQFGNGNHPFGDSMRIHTPKRFDWGPVWHALVDSSQRCADVAAERGKTVAIEPGVDEVISSVDALLRLMEQVRRKNFKANFNTAHFSAERENISLALTRLRGKFANVRISDSDPSNNGHLPIGDGAIDWREFFRVLKNMKYNGYLGLDLGRSKSLCEDYRKSLAHLKSLASELRFPIEI